MRTALSLLLIPALAAACTTAPAPEPAPMSPPSAPPAMSMSGGFPTGTYTTTIAEGDIPANAPAEMRSMMAGGWVIAFGADGHALVTFNGRQVVDAPYRIIGSELVLTDDTGEYACHSRARYTWHAAGNELHLTRVEDACDGRVVALTAHPLVRR